MREEVLAAILAADKELSRDEPEVAANIGQQLEHMGLTTWSISVRRRIRDAIARLSPKNIIHRTTRTAHSIFFEGLASKANNTFKQIGFN